MANEKQQLVFSSVPSAESLLLRASGGVATATITPATSNANIELAIEGLPEYDAVTITGALTNSGGIYSGTLNLEFVAADALKDVPQLQVMPVENQTYTATNVTGNGVFALGGTDLGAGGNLTIVPGENAAAVLAKIKAFPGYNDAGVTASGGIGALTSSGYIVSGAGDASYNGTYVPSGTLNGATLFVLSSTRHLYWSTTQFQWNLGTAAHEEGSGSIYFSSTVGQSATAPPTTGWTANFGTAPAPTVAAGSSTANGSVAVVFGGALAGKNIANPTVTGAGWTSTTNREGGGLHPLVTVTTLIQGGPASSTDPNILNATGTGVVRDRGKSTTTGWTAQVNCTTVLDAAANIVITVKHSASADKSAPTTIATFPAISTVGSQRIISAANNTELRRYVWADHTITGGTGAGFQVAVAVADRRLVDDD